ncbi:MAG TPA: helix-turn-helix transcriptional regulator [Polyangiaceae bacterium]|jgi:DNA-binding CsgD family transcriptional regulator|nr:helix-turn-helix transcriptional regulator [Polyangiaceae bacterium]
METNVHLNQADRDRLVELSFVLNSSLDLQRVMTDAYPQITGLIPAEHAAFCVQKPGRDADYDWIVADLPPAFFENYPTEMAEDDFVRKAVARRPNVALRDTDMISRKELLSNRMYGRVRDHGLRLEHVMAVMLTFDGERHGGLTLYRGGDEPFSERDQGVLQMLTRMLANTVRNCERYRGLATASAVLRHLTTRQGVGLIVLADSGEEVYRTDLTTRLLGAWFPANERRRGALPERLAIYLTRTEGALAPKMTKTWIDGPTSDLRATFTRVPAPGCGVLTVIELHEFPHILPVPDQWAEVLTPAIRKVASRAISGWDNQLIADDLDRSVNTIKTQIREIFDLLGVSSREALMVRAARDR